MTQPFIPFTKPTIDEATISAVADVLRYVQFDAKKLIASYTKQLAKLEMAEDRKDELLDELKAGVYGYTYFED